jgi:type II secretory pathway pseudopilin PulG
LDPDTVYGDNLTFQWDFDASDGPFQAQFVGMNGRWDFPTAGNYMITLRIVDNAGNYLEATKNITVNGLRDDEDFDNDGMSNKWEDENGLDKYDPSDAEDDSDGDGLSNYLEFLNRTDPRRRDTDGDGAADGEDFSPLDSTVWKEPSGESDDSGNLILILVIVALIILILALVAGFMLFRSMKRSKEEEERRKKAEELQKTTYEDQDLYSNLPSMDQVPQEAVGPAPSAPRLPPQQEEGIDDIFGGAGVLPSQQPAQEGLPPGPAGTGQPAQAPAEQGDVTDLLDN